MYLQALPKISGHRRQAKRLGRGHSSGKGGHTTIRGQKGQKSRGKVKYWFEGGQKPLIHRLPFRGGFKRLALDRICFNLDQIDKIYKEGELVSLKTLAEKGALNRTPHAGVKILGRGRLTKKLRFSNDLLLSRSVQHVISS